MSGPGYECIGQYQRVTVIPAKKIAPSSPIRTSSMRKICLATVSATVLAAMSARAELSPETMRGTNLSWGNIENPQGGQPPFLVMRGWLANPTSVSVNTAAATPVSITVDLAQPTAGTLLALTTVTALQPGMPITGAGIPTNTTISSITGGLQHVSAANGSFSSGQKTIPLANTLGFVGGMQCFDTTNTAAIGLGNAINAVNTNVSIVLTNNILQN